MEIDFHEELEAVRGVTRLARREDDFDGTKQKSEWFYTKDVYRLICAMARVAQDENDAEMAVFHDGEILQGAIQRCSRRRAASSPGFVPVTLAVEERDLRNLPVPEGAYRT